MSAGEVLGSSRAAAGRALSTSTDGVPQPLWDPGPVFDHSHGVWGGKEVLISAWNFSSYSLNLLLSLCASEESLTLSSLQPPVQ